jgi:hypothetical protein
MPSGARRQAHKKQQLSQKPLTPGGGPTGRLLTRRGGSSWRRVGGYWHPARVYPRCTSGSRVYRRSAGLDITADKSGPRISEALVGEVGEGGAVGNSSGLELTCRKWGFNSFGVEQGMTRTVGLGKAVKTCLEAFDQTLRA